MRDEAEELAIGGDAHRRLADGQGDELGVRGLGWAPGPRGLDRQSAK